MKNHSLTQAIISGLIFIASFGVWIFLLTSTEGIENATLALNIAAANDRANETAIFSEASVARDAAAPSEELSSMFASSSDVASVVKAVEKSGESLGLDVSLSSISANTDASTPLSPLSFGVSASGSWHNLLAFAAAIESLPYDISLSKVSLFENASDPKGNWHIEMDASSFVSN